MKRSATAVKKSLKHMQFLFCSIIKLLKAVTLFKSSERMGAGWSQSCEVREVKFTVTAQNSLICCPLYILDVSTRPSPFNTVLIYSPLYQHLFADKEWIRHSHQFIQKNSLVIYCMSLTENLKIQVFFAAISDHRRQVSKNTRFYTLHQRDSCFHKTVMNYWAKERPVHHLVQFLYLWRWWWWWLVGGMKWTLRPRNDALFPAHSYGVRGRLKFRPLKR